MAEHGGYRRPAHPAPTSGPGSQSRRTDGGPGDHKMIRELPGARYGEQAAFQAAQQAAPMAGGRAAGGGAGPPVAPAPSPSPLDAPTARPDEPITAGADAGAGPDAQSAGIQTDIDKQDAEHLRPLVTSLEYIANMPGAAPSTRAFVRMLKARL